MTNSQKNNKESKSTADKKDMLNPASSEFVFCSQCGCKNKKESSFCMDCGNPLRASKNVPKQIALNPSVSKPKKALHSKLKKMLILTSIFLVIVIAGTLALSIISAKRNKFNYAIYIKNGELYCSSLKNIEPWKVTSKFPGDNEASGNFLATAFSMYSHANILSQDGKILFFTDRLSGENYSFNLYFRHMNKKNDEPVKIDSDILRYSISDSGKKLVYVTSDNGKLYTYDVKKQDKEKIAENVVAYYLSNDGNRIIYVNTGSNLYSVDGKKEEKIAENVYSIEYVTEDLKTIYYKSDKNLYKLNEENDSELITENIGTVHRVYDSGKAYYTRQETKSFKLSDYVIDDLAAHDASMTSPIKPTEIKAPSRYDYGDYDKFKVVYQEYLAKLAVYQKELDVYNTEMKKYNEKLDRDKLRNELSTAEYSIEFYNLCYFDGSEEKIISNTLNLSASQVTVAPSEAENAVVIFSGYCPGDVEKVNLSSISSLNVVESQIESANLQNSKNYLAVNENVNLIDYNEIYMVKTSNDGKLVTFVRIPSDGPTELYKISIEGTTPAKPELLDDEISHNSPISITKNNNVIYFKSEENRVKGSLYFDGDCVDHDVYLYCFSYTEDGTLYYISDYDSISNEDITLAYSGNLKRYRNGKTKKLASDVLNFSITDRQEILYISDYDIYNYTGDLYLYKNNKSIKVDKNVTSASPISHSDSSRLYYSSNDLVYYKPILK